MAPDAGPERARVLSRPLTVVPLDPHEIWARHVQGRRVVYLDTNVWVRLTDARTQLDRDCLALCRRTVAAGVAVFPLSYASISELLHQPSDAPRAAQAALMDELSLGVTFRSVEAVHDLEARAAFQYFSDDNYEPVSRSSLFTYVVDYVADGAIELASGTTAEHVGSLVDHWNTSGEVRSVLWLLDHLDLKEIRDRHEASGRRFVELMSQNIKDGEEHYRSQKQFSSSRLRHEERVALFQSDVLPVFHTIMLERYPIEEIPSRRTTITQRFGQRHGRGGPKVLEKLFFLMPATELFAQLMASRTLNPARAVRPQDFWDIEHARVAAAYADAFVAVDRGLVDLLDSRAEIPRAQGCHIIGKLDSFAQTLRAYLQSPSESETRAGTDSV